MIFSAAQDQKAVLARTVPIQLGAIPTTPRTARASARAQLAAWGRGDLAADVEEIVSELTTNAVQASASAATPIAVRLILTTASVIVEVLDFAPGVPAPRRPDQAAESGRGLLLVASIAREWGWVPAHGGKLVWAEVTP